MELTWFRRPGPESPGTLNLAYNAVDLQVIRGRAQEIALEGARPLDFAILLEHSSALAGGLQSLAVVPGSPVAGEGLDERERLLLLLAVLRLGGVHTDGSTGEPLVTLVPETLAEEMRLGRHEPAACADLPPDAPALVRDGRTLTLLEALEHDDWAGRALATLVTGGRLEAGE